MKLILPEKTSPRLLLTRVAKSVGNLDLVSIKEGFIE
jgi:hypothetical protein